MIIQFSFQDHLYEANLNQAIDLSIPLQNDMGPNCFHAPKFSAKPLEVGDFVGDTRQGSPVNFYNVQINPHGNGTHTECIGHITRERYYILDQLKATHLAAQLITIHPSSRDSDEIIDRQHLASKIEEGIKGLVIRTMPNDNSKLDKKYSGKNPPYFTPAAMQYIVECGIEHLIVDLPSVDREEDDGLVKCHKIFWGIPDNQRMNATITELVYIPNKVSDGIYLCNLQVPPFKIDAAPSRVMLYKLKKI